MKKVITFITIFLFTTTSFATESKIEVINKGTPAPYTGVLIDSKTGAKILAEKEFAKERCQVEVEHEKQKAESKCELEKTREVSDKEFELAKTKVLLEASEKENERLTKVVEETSEDYSAFWFVGGTLSGILLSVGIFYASVQIAR
tara:strand:- start:97544 stop:97981 length:438 start_codon:yes stop_codon:yes gene_type:complete